MSLKKLLYIYRTSLEPFCAIPLPEQKKYEGLIRQPNGIILITGPTGSGKTTTLYACLNFLNRPDKKLITVELPDGLLDLDHAAPDEDE